MHRIDAPGTSAALPTPETVGDTVGFFTEGDPVGGLSPTTVSADWCNAVQEELAYVIEQAGLTLDKAVHTQLKAAILALAPGAITKGNLTEAVSSVLTIVGGTNSVLGSGTSIQVKQASGSQAGVLSSADWNTFNNKASAFIAPTVQTLKTGSGTYTRPTPAPLYLKIRVIGGGGGGAGSSGSTTGTSAQNGGTGGTSTFGTSLLTATGGQGGQVTGPNNTTGGVGGTPTVNSPAIEVLKLTGCAGGGSFYNAASTSLQMLGGSGGSSPLGGGGPQTQGVGAAGLANTGSGGSGSGQNAPLGNTNGSGGGSGGYIEAIVTSPSASYSWSCGVGGSAGAAGSGGAVGGAGGSGVVIVEEHYQ